MSDCSTNAFKVPEKPELKDCPFCGSNAVVVNNSGAGMYAYCKSCDAIGTHVPYDEDNRTATLEAIEAWNTRYQPTCHWERTDRCTWTCSNCGVETEVLYQYWLHCPVCGAKVVK